MTDRRLRLDRRRYFPVLALRVTSRQRSISVALGAKRTLTESRFQKADRKQAANYPYNREARIIRVVVSSLFFAIARVDDLPSAFRTVFVLRIVEGFRLEETSDLLGIKVETVKTRLHRARALLKTVIDHELGSVLSEAFPFAGTRCDESPSAAVEYWRLARVKARRRGPTRSRQNSLTVLRSVGRAMLL
jgi:hypothetical protein